VLYATTRALVEAEFPPSIAGDVFTAVGLDPDQIYGQAPASNTQDLVAQPRRLRSGGWPAQILEAWDRQCAFCGYDGQLGSGPVGLKAAHVRWFDFDGPDALHNGLALCALHHKSFDRGALGLPTTTGSVSRAACRRVPRLVDASATPPINSSALVQARHYQRPTT
jgi:putative restriction endonuclease